MLDSVRPPEGGSDRDMPIEVNPSEGKVLWTNALAQLRAALLKASNQENAVEDKPIPEVLVHLYEITERKFNPLLDDFGIFCAKHGIDANPYLEFIRKAAKGKPVLIGNMRTLLQVTVGILTRMVGLEPEVLPVSKRKPVLVGGPVHRHAEQLASAIAARLGLNRE